VGSHKNIKCDYVLFVAFFTPFNDCRLGWWQMISTPKHVAFLLITFNIHTSIPNITVSCPKKTGKFINITVRTSNTATNQTICRATEQCTSSFCQFAELYHSCLQCVQQAFWCLLNTVQAKIRVNEVIIQNLNNTAIDTFHTGHNQNRWKSQITELHKFLPHRYFFFFFFFIFRYNCTVPWNLLTCNQPENWLHL
jgi:hypothetical protein